MRLRIASVLVAVSTVAVALATLSVRAESTGLSGGFYDDAAGQRGPASMVLRITDGAATADLIVGGIALAADALANGTEVYGGETFERYLGTATGSVGSLPVRLLWNPTDGILVVSLEKADSFRVAVYGAGNANAAQELLDRALAGREDYLDVGDSYTFPLASDDLPPTLAVTPIVGAPTLLEPVIAPVLGTVGTIATGSSTYGTPYLGPGLRNTDIIAAGARLFLALGFQPRLSSHLTTFDEVDISSGYQRQGTILAWVPELDATGTEVVFRSARLTTRAASSPVTYYTEGVEPPHGTSTDVDLSATFAIGHGGIPLDARASYRDPNGVAARVMVGGREFIGDVDFTSDARPTRPDRAVGFRFGFGGETGPAGMHGMAASARIHYDRWECGLSFGCAPFEHVAYTGEVYHSTEARDFAPDEQIATGRDFDLGDRTMSSGVSNTLPQGRSTYFTVDPSGRVISCWFQLNGGEGALAQWHTARFSLYWYNPQTGAWANVAERVALVPPPPAGTPAIRIWADVSLPANLDLVYQSRYLCRLDVDDAYETSLSFHVGP